MPLPLANYLPRLEPLSGQFAGMMVRLRSQSLLFLTRSENNAPLKWSLYKRMRFSFRLSVENRLKQSCSCCFLTTSACMVTDMSSE